jgi:Kef-type K+ transport system membrane component KefB
MLKLLVVHFSLTDPVFQFALLLSIILFAPVIANQIKLPGMVGLIIAGMILGPGGIDVLAMKYIRYSLGGDEGFIVVSH